MKYLHSWIAEYIEDTENLLPKGEEFVKGVSTDAFEVEEYFEIENKLNGGKDFIYDLNVLPNRAHDALSHYYMAKEVATIFNLKMKKLQEFSFSNLNLASEKLSEENSLNNFIKISDSKACTRFMGAKVSGVEVKESPDFIKYRLESIGQKSINNIVDITNYVQFSFNKPMHAYDESLVSEFLETRFAKEGEVMTTLDNKDLALDENTLVIADFKKVLALAGIKGGNSSGISNNTKNIIVESANFNPILIRKTAQKYNLKTDASKRFENGIADNLVEIGMIETLNLLKEYAVGENFKIEWIEDNWPKQKINSWKYKVSVSLLEINKVLGTTLNINEVKNIFDRFGFDYKYISTKVNLENFIKEVVGKSYKNPSTMRIDAPNTFSCSSLISYIYEGVFMPSVSIDKYLYTRELGNNIKNKSDLKFGDFVFINTGNVVSTGIYYKGIEYKKEEEVIEGIDHLAMYIGDGNVIHSSSQLENGTDIESIERFLERGKFVGYGRLLEDVNEERFVVTIPEERLDLRIKEDIIEEMGRIYGLNNIKSILPILDKKIGLPNKRLYWENKIKNILLKNGFSEVMTYSLKNKGDIKILKSVAMDKNYLRNNLSEGIQESVQKNIFNMPLLNINEVKIFEFGNCFNVNENGLEKEWRSLTIAMDDGKKNKNYIEIKNQILEEIKKELNISDIKITESKNDKQKENCIEIDFDEMINTLEIGEYIELENIATNKEIKYKSFSMMPFIVRDIALWTDENTKEEEIEKIIKENISDICVSVNLFDKFEKEIDGIKKKSFGFRLIYQDKNKTLTDEEVNLEADKVYKALKERGFEIR